MACKTTVEGANGKSTLKVDGNDVKILVVGDRMVGKSTYISRFAQRFGNAAGDVDQTEYARMYSAMFDVDGVARSIKILEIFGGDSVEQVDELTKDHYDNYGIAFVFAIDNPLSFESLITKWIPAMENNKSKEKQPCIVVGNKRDLRDNPQVISRLAQLGQAPVPFEFGVLLAEELWEKDAYYETLSIDENDAPIQASFTYLVKQSIPHFIADTGTQ